MADAVVTIQDDELKALCSRLNGMALAASDRHDLLNRIGVEMVGQTKDRFQTKVTPDGDDWEKLADATEKYYLRKYGDANPFKGLLWRNSPVPLRDTIQSEAGTWDVLVGAASVYAAVHQFGYKKIPPRPYLGLAGDDKEDVVKTIELFIAEKMK